MTGGESKVVTIEFAPEAVGAANCTITTGTDCIDVVCSGVGAHWTGMAKALLEDEPVFREALERCDAELAPLWGESALAALERANADFLDAAFGIASKA